MSWPKGRRQPYTAIGISRLQCIRCGQGAQTQWSICADGNVHRPLCIPCDIDLNAMVLTWAGDPDAKAKIEAYANKINAEYVRREMWIPPEKFIQRRKF